MTDGFEGQGQDSTLHPHHHLVFCWCFSKHRKPLTSQNASGSLGSFSHGKWCCFCVNCSSHHKFPTLCYSVTSSGRGLFTSHLSRERRWRGWVWTPGSAPEGLQQKWWPLRDGMLICVGGMWALCIYYEWWSLHFSFVLITGHFLKNTHGCMPEQFLLKYVALQSLFARRK